MKEHFIKKYMRLAKQVGEDENRCYARQIGSVLVRVYDDDTSRILGTGYNSPPKDVPHCNSQEHLQEIFWPQLTTDEKNSIVLPILTKKQDENLLKKFNAVELKDEEKCQLFCEEHAGKPICPRKLINAASGKRLELCTCAHSETNAIVNSTQDLYGAWLFCWCPLPCLDCTKLIINARIKKVICLKSKDYSHGSRWLFNKANVEIIEHPEEYYLSVDQ